MKGNNPSQKYVNTCRDNSREIISNGYKEKAFQQSGINKDVAVH